MNNTLSKNSYSHSPLLSANDQGDLLVKNRTHAVQKEIHSITSTPNTKQLQSLLEQYGFVTQIDEKSSSQNTLGEIINITDFLTKIHYKIQTDINYGGVNLSFLVQELAEVTHLFRLYIKQLVKYSNTDIETKIAIIEKIITQCYLSIFDFNKQKELDHDTLSYYFYSTLLFNREILPLLPFSDNRSGEAIDNSLDIHFDTLEHISQDILTLSQGDNNLPQEETLREVISHGEIKDRIISQLRLKAEQLKQEVPNPETQALLNKVKEQAEKILNLTETNERLEEISTHDSLTGIPNRRQYELDYDSLQAQLNRMDNLTHYSYIFFDLNKFKEINDNHGHDVGDKALILFSQILQKNIRKSDKIYRIGGDEFIAFAQSKESNQGIKNFIERLINDLKNSPLRFKNNAGKEISIPLTTSIGIAPITEGKDLKAVCNEADHAMYAAKEAGKLKEGDIQSIYHFSN